MAHPSLRVQRELTLFELGRQTSLITFGNRSGESPAITGPYVRNWCPATRLSTQVRPTASAFGRFGLRSFLPDGEVSHNFSM
jgi:hypothetical protein